MNTFFKVRKAKKILFQVYYLFRKKRHNLPLATQKEFIAQMDLLQTRVIAGQKSSFESAKKLEKMAREHLKRGFFEKIFDFCVALFTALVVAIVFRQMCAELYSIPTGSMRPTLREEDTLIVSKSQFGLNIPLSLGHIFFQPEAVKRGGIVVFSGEGMDIPDVDTHYFYLFPGKKQYVKRLMGLPGDTLYFYGGKMYGIDKEGNDITSFLQDKSFQAIEHIPFLSFEGVGRSALGSPSVMIHQMNQPVANIYKTSHNTVRTEMMSLSKVRDSAAGPIKRYMDLWGFKNFGMARILSRKDLKHFTEKDPVELGLESEDYYLEISHSPQLSRAQFMMDNRGFYRLSLGLSRSYLPLTPSMMKSVFHNLYTARFVVNNGHAHRLGSSLSLEGRNNYRLPNFDISQDGVYEFYYGKCYRIGFKGIRYELDKDQHPIYSEDSSRIKMLFNLGIEVDTEYSPREDKQFFVPSRYVYFRNGDLYLMGLPFLSKDSLELETFIKNEEAKVKNSYEHDPYIAFQDYGPPFVEGKIDSAFIKQFGLRVPDKHYLVLGDNHAMSADSRVFGFVPEENLRGCPDFRFWPIGRGFGFVDQPHYQFFTVSRLVVWGLLGGSLLIGYFIRKKRRRLPIEF